jgi:anti-sigma factor RsiW
MSTSADTERRDLEIQAYFDGELAPAERERFEAELGRDPALAARIADLEAVRRIVIGGLEAAAREVPDARFEQIWDEIDAGIDRDGRLQEAATKRPSLWSRLRPLLRPAVVPLAALGAAAAFVVVIVSSTEDPSNTGAQTASNDAVPAPEPRTVTPAEPTPAVAEPSPPVAEFPAPASNVAEVERIEFGGHTGRIEQLEGTRGTTTVIWIEEDDEPIDSERSL